MSVLLIAEAGVNHNGDLSLAHQLVDAAADAGAEAVKFQTFVPEQLASQHAAKAGYQQHSPQDNENQLAMLRELALGHRQHRELLAHCIERGITFLSSPFDSISASFLTDELQLPVIKLGSGELTNGPLLWQLARSDRSLILSTGMATLEEIRDALGLLCHAQQTSSETPQSDDFGGCFVPGLLDRRVTLLHCTTEYPCPPGNVNLLAMDTLKDTFGLPVGYSDHTQGIDVALAAAARGARVIEKHFTLDRKLPGPDHVASLMPDELSALIRGVRTIEQALGSGQKCPGPVETENARVARKSLCALEKLAAGAPFTPDNLGSKRPGNGMSPMHFWELLGEKASREYAADELIQLDELAKHRTEHL